MSAMLLTARPEPSGLPPKRAAWRAQRVPVLGNGIYALPVLDELPSDVAYNLFRAAEDVALWAETDIDNRKGLFAVHQLRGVPEVPTGLTDLMEALAQVGTEPDAVHAKELSATCAGVSAWAKAAGYKATEIIFVELAAAVDAENAMRSLIAARVLRQAGRYERARRWFDRALGVAVRYKDHRAQVETYLSAGLLEERVNQLGRAYRLYRKAYRGAKRNGFRDLGAAAHHNAMGNCLQTRKFHLSQEHAEAAVALYGPSHPTIPALAQDIAQLWSYQGYYDIALMIFRAALDALTGLEQRYIVTANIARAAAGIGDRELFHKSWYDFEKIGLAENDYTSEALVRLGEGALMLGLQPVAIDLAQKAGSIAEVHRQPFTVIEARELALRAMAGTPAVPRSPAPDRERALAHRLRGILKNAARR